MHSIVDGNVVLHLDVIAYRHIVTDEDVLTKGTPLANPSTGTNVNEMPDATAIANLCTLLYYQADTGAVAEDEFQDALARIRQAVAS